MYPRKSYRTLVYMAMIMGLVTAIIVSNVLFTMMTHTHLRSGLNILAQKENSQNNETIVRASRGGIYDRNGEVIANDEVTYTLIAYLDETRLGIGNVPAYVTDINKTAKLLSEKLDLEEDWLAQLMIERKAANAKQIEFGPKAKNLSSTVMKSIAALELPGIDFTQTVTREYPNSKFASSLIGFAQYDDEKGKSVGQMGLEQTLEQYLAGEDGKTISQKDKSGNSLPGTTYVEKYVKNGNDVILTLDQNVQLAMESMLQKTMKFPGKPEKAWAIAMEVETGKILGYAGYPTFDLNTREGIDKSYTDLPSEFIYEPGSVIKGMTFSAALQEGKYPYNESYRSGTFYYNEFNGKIVRVGSQQEAMDKPIYDAEAKDHGVLSFDEGFALSSNIAICELLTNYISPAIYEKYLDKFGFLKSVNVPFVENAAGNINTGSVRSQLSTGFGQSINVTALQMVQAYSAILNDGNMVRPYIVNRIEDSNSHKVVKQFGTEIVGTPISQETSEYMRGLMKKVMETGTGERYKMDDVDIIAKTGTGEVSDEKGYRTEFWTNSVIAAAPADDPKVMIYYAFQSGDYYYFSGDAFKEAMRELLIAEGITSEAASNHKQKETNDYEEYQMPSLINHTLEYAADKLKDMKVNQVIIGNGDAIVSQYPNAKTEIISNQNVFLLSDGTKITMPDMSGWTMKDVTAFWKLTGIQIQMEGSGSVSEQSVKPGKSIGPDSEITVKLK